MSKKKINWKAKWETAKQVASKTGRVSQSVANGVFGDRLDKWNLPIAQELTFIHQNSPLSLDKENLKSLLTQSKICILVHGLVSDETMWKYEPSTDYGKEVQKEFGYIPFYVRYNTGRHISDNGQDLDRLLSELIKNSTTKIKEIIFFTHSMGGLVTRSACYYGKKRKSKWIPLAKKIFYIGSPHHGAPLEKFGNTVTTVLGKIPNPFTYLTKEAINLRSAGIKDLRYGFLVEEDWKGKDLDSFVLTEKTHVPLLPSAEHYIITGTVGKISNNLASEFFGDAIVGKWSSQGKSGNPKYNLEFKPQNAVEIAGVSHIQLMHDAKVYDALRGFLAK